MLILSGTGFIDDDFATVATGGNSSLSFSAFGSSSDDEEDVDVGKIFLGGVDAVALVNFDRFIDFRSSGVNVPSGSSFPSSVVFLLKLLVGSLTTLS